MRHNFKDKLSFSRGEREARDKKIIKKMIDGCVSVEKTDPDTDRLGVDYIATLRRGAKIYVDAKTREKGASKYWKYGEPEIALEKWSVVPSGGKPGKVGWTLSEASPVHKILYTFDPSDTIQCFFLDFQNLRMAFSKYCKEWEKKYPLTTQDNGGWKSQAMFVPVSVVEKAMHEFTHGDTSAFVRGRSIVRMSAPRMIKKLIARSGQKRWTK